MNLFQFSGGKIAEIWVNADDLGELQQIAVVPESECDLFTLKKLAPGSIIWLHVTDENHNKPGYLVGHLTASLSGGAASLLCSPG